MASAKKRNTSLMSYKLKFLKYQRDNFIKAVGLFVNKIITVTDAWIEGEASNLGYLELCQSIETASAFLCEKADEVTDNIQQKPIIVETAVTEEATSSFRSNAEKVADQQSDFDQLHKECAFKLSEPAKNNSRFRQVTEQVSDSSDAQGAINQEQKTQIESLQKQLQKVLAAQDRLEVEMKSQAELISKIIPAYSQVEYFKEHVDVVCGTVQFLSEDQDQNLAILKEMETRLKTLEEDCERNVGHVMKQAEKGEANLAGVIHEIACVSPRLHQLELKCSRISCGFSAETLIAGEIEENIIRQYEITHTNIGDNFDADSGVFTAPVDGLYVASISLLLSDEEALQVAVKYRQHLEGILSTSVCVSSAMAKHTTSCGIGVVAMKAGDMLFSYVYKMGKNVHGKVVFFSCFSLG